MKLFIQLIGYGCILVAAMILGNWFLAEFLDRLEQRIHRPDLAGVIAEWKTCSATLGRQVRIVSNREVTEGTAMDVDSNGALVVRKADGTLEKIYYGDCFHKIG